MAAKQFPEEDVFRPLVVQAPFIPEPTAGQVKRAIAVLQEAKRPIILAGNGVLRRHAKEAIRRCART